MRRSACQEKNASSFPIFLSAPSQEQLQEPSVGRRSTGRGPSFGKHLATELHVLRGLDSVEHLANEFPRRVSESFAHGGQELGELGLQSRA